jgi:hypothetical protein
LSSDEKAELQRLNPERYKAWEEFYMQKYPGFQPLNTKQCGCNRCESCVKQRPVPDPADNYVICGVSGWALVRKAEMEDSAITKTPYYCLKRGWQVWSNRVSMGKHYSDFKISKYWSQLQEGDRCPLWPALADRFEQYYTQLEQNPLKFKGLLEKAKDVKKRDPSAPDNFEFIFDGLSYYITEPDRVKNTGPTNVGRWENNQVAIVMPAECSWLGPFTALSGATREILYKRNKERFNEWVDFYDKKKDKILGIAERAKEAVFGKNTAPGTYGSDYDIDKQQNYTPNLKQQNNAPINVQRKTATVIRGQNLTGHSIQSQRSQPSVATGYPQYRPRVVCVKKEPGSCQIGLSF